MFETLISTITGIAERQVAETIALLGDGCTIPFIARYRKEATGGLDEVQISEIAHQLERLQTLAKRKEFILDAIEKQGKLTDELRKRIEESWNETEIEDIYLPYKQKRRTRATVARENGCEPLAKIIMSGGRYTLGDERNAQRGVWTEEDEQGAKDIIAEWVSEHEGARNTIRGMYRRVAWIESKKGSCKDVPDETVMKYRDYFDKRFSLNRCPSHALLAMRRGEAEKVLRVQILIEEEEAVMKLNNIFARPGNNNNHVIKEAVEDGYKRLLQPSIETEFAASSKQKADEEAVRVFQTNLRQLLLASPLGQKRVMGIDPGFRTGCKIVCLDAQGQLLHHDVVNLRNITAGERILELCKRYKMEAIAIGNGTASRETEAMVRDIPFKEKMPVFVVSESGASIYSASEVAREEFPDYDVTVRGAVSIGRRLMDPLAELVKIDPKSIGVGQYQHDVDQTMLKRALDETVMSCVNSVGVEVNNASKQLLTYVAGIGPKLAENIVKYRDENGAFESRAQLKKVPLMGPKAFEQSAGFLRIREAAYPLDRSAVHPERYAVVEKMAKEVGATVEQLMEKRELREKIDVRRYLNAEQGLGMETLTDIMQELEKPGRDPRTQIEEWSFDPNIKQIGDLYEGLVLNGIITNVTNFGAFVDIGIHTNGLIHISKIPRGKTLAVDQRIVVKVAGIDYERNRISLLIEN